jgi:phosphoribosylformimino-5-aminoimidazole carboxamide ribotide isomerase
MIVYPAIDLRGGRVVRLVQGDPRQETVFSDDPVETAQHWKAAGAEWLHVINLDGALGAGGLKLDLIKRLADTGLKVQFGGGIRSLDDVQTMFDACAVARVVLGTIVVQQPSIAGQAIERFGEEAITIALDAKDGLVAVYGWQTQTAWTPIRLGLHLAEMGVRYALYTDINRDGKLHGANVKSTADLAEKTGLQIIASGGVSSLEDIRALKEAHPGIVGVVVGKALYTHALSLKAAIDLTNDSSS